MNWLITGGCGFIGRALIDYLQKHGVRSGRIRVLDNLSVGSVEDLQMVAMPRTGDAGWSEQDVGCALYVGDIRDPGAVGRAMNGANCVVHLAACTGVQPSLDDPRFDCETNVLGTFNCLDAARAAGATRFIFASSGAPLGSVTPPIHEELAPHPISPYGASKLAGEGYCSAYFHSFGLSTTALRFGNVYGPLSSRKSSIVAKFIRQALSGQTFEIYGDGSATRDYIFIDDLARAITLAASSENAGGETFQIATSRETTVAEITEHLIDILEKKGISGVKVHNGETRKGDMQRNYSDTSKARAVLGWTADVSLREGLERTVDWYLTQKH